VMLAYRDSFSISGAILTYNSADLYSGVMETYKSYSASLIAFSVTIQQKCVVE
jgi:hypothetical protein